MQYAVVAAVCHVNIAVTVNANTRRSVELAHAVALTSHRPYVSTIAVELLQPVIAPIGYVDRSINLVNGDAPRIVELTIILAILAETGNVLTRRCKPLHAVVPAINNEHLAIMVERQAARAVHLTVAGTVLAPL